ncbi:MAG: bifunctional phosphopantothenoylcysteine decarboxylase/phosphopantothenate--cysteine ligase CoaBC [Chloroflexi bacterium]|nr:bifunctional phosphopantothenoylcysteine decarboxylase/phosphopantothenate--cysteine ligase CoaBC [Chloroflexota bacterium]
MDKNEGSQSKAGPESPKPLENKTIVLGITGSIAAYKGADLASRLTQEGAVVEVVMTKEAQEFITPVALGALTRRPVVSDMFHHAASHQITHVNLGQKADIVVVAPATANIIAKLAAGIGDDELTCTVLATQSPVLIAPAMHAAMYLNRVTQDNIGRLKERGVSFVGPVEGRLASGHFGPGRFAENTDIIGAIHQILGRKGNLAGKRIVVTAGGTQEPIDPVRYITNRSSGKMGFAIAAAARDRGAEVTLVTAPVSLAAPYGVKIVRVNTAAEMFEAVAAATASADGLIMAAAVADYHVASAAANKIKRERGTLTLELAPNPDILESVKGDFARVGFAAESENLIENARKKLEKKRLDLIVANDISATDSGFGSDNNRVTLLSAGGKVEDLPLLPKSVVADRILDRLVSVLREKGHSIH